MPGYPYATGYAEVADVAAMISGGAWDPTLSTARPTSAQVGEFLLRASAAVDMVLARAGYTVPLTPAPTAPGGIIQPQAWALLEDITALMAAARVQMVRHGSQEGNQNADKSSDEFIKLADDMLTRIEGGDDNLGPFGVDGRFEFDPDPAQAVSSGSLTYDPVSDSLIGHDGRVGAPTFTRGMRF